MNARTAVLFLSMTIFFGCTSSDDDTKIIQLPADHHGPVIIVDGEQDLNTVIENGILFVQIPHSWFAEWGRTSRVVFVEGAAAEIREYWLIGGPILQLFPEKFPAVMIWCPGSPERRQPCHPLFDVEDTFAPEDVWGDERFLDALKNYLTR